MWLLRQTVNCLSQSPHSSIASSAQKNLAEIPNITMQFIVDSEFQNVVQLLKEKNDHTQKNSTKINLVSLDTGEQHIQNPLKSSSVKKL